MLRLGKGFDRKAVRAALEARQDGTVRYDGVLDAQDIREAVAGVREAGSPSAALPVLAWLAAHPNTPEDVLRDLEAHGPREVALSLCLNAQLPADLREALLRHEDAEVREQAYQRFERAGGSR